MTAYLPSKGNLWVWYLAAMAILTGLYLFVVPFKGYAALINLIGLCAVLAIAVGMWVHRPRASMAWLLILAGQSLYFAGDFYTYSYPELLGGTVGFPLPGTRCTCSSIRSSSRASCCSCGGGSRRATRPPGSTH